MHSPSVCVLFSICSYATSQHRQHTAANYPSMASMEDITLLKDEGGGLMMEEGIATISFYKGDAKQATTALRRQLELVVAANPWLTGVLVKAKSGGVALRHSSSPAAAEIDAVFKSETGELSPTQA